MIWEALKVLALVNGFIAVALGGFIELTKLFNQLGVSPWWTPVVYLWLYVWWWMKQCGGANDRA